MVVQSAPASAPAEQRITLRDISWELYEQILAVHVDKSAPRFVYDRGDLEIISPFPDHEVTNRAIARLIETVAEVLDIDYENLGSTTFNRADLGRGFEGDSCFYFGRVPTIRQSEYIDLHRDPPPDLVVEIDVSRSSLNQLGLFAAFGVPEAWRHKGDRLEIHELVGDSYIQRDSSVVLPGVRADEVFALVEGATNERRREWLRKVRAWAEGLPR
jgi:Uma2 family endonuclease